MRKSKISKIGSQIVTNLHGYTFEVVGWRLKLSYPHLHVKHMTYDREVRSNTTALFIRTASNHVYMAQTTPFNCWVLFKLKYLSYNELEDIRKSHLHGNRYHS